MIATLLTIIIQLETQTKQTIFQLKRLFQYLLFEPVEELLKKIVPSGFS